MTTDPDDGEDEWRFSLEDIKDREDSEDSEDSEDAGSEATESSGHANSAERSSAEHSSGRPREDGAAVSEVTESSGAASGDTPSSAGNGEEGAEDGGFDAGVAGRMEFSEELEAGKIDIENALFISLGVLLAVAFFAGFLNLFP